MFIFHVLFVAELASQRTDSKSDKEDPAAAQQPFATWHATQQTVESVPSACNDKQVFESAGVSCPSANGEVASPDNATSLCGDIIVPLSLSSSATSPCSSDRNSKPAVNAAATVVESHVSSTVADVSILTHSALVIVDSDEVFVGGGAHSLLQSPLSGWAPACQHEEERLSFTSNAVAADDLLMSGKMEANSTFKISPLQSLHSSFHDNISSPSSPSESESEPIGGCRDILLNPDHCISDLCLDDDDDDDDSVFGASGFQSPAAALRCQNMLSVEACPSLPSSLANTRIKHDSENLLDLSKFDLSSFSNSHSIKSDLEFGPNSSACDESKVNSGIMLVTGVNPFKSPPKSPMFEETSFYSSVFPFNNSSPFRSPPKSSVCRSDVKPVQSKTAEVENVETSGILPSESVMMHSGDGPCSVEVVDDERMIVGRCTSSRESDVGAGPSVFASCSNVVSAFTDNLPNTFSIKDSADGDFRSVDMLDCQESSPVIPCAHDERGQTSDLSVATAEGNSTEMPLDKVTDLASEDDFDCCAAETRCFDMCSQNGKGKRTSVKQLKTKFESPMGLGPQMGRRSLPNFAAFVPSFVEFELDRDATRSQSPHVTKSAEFSCSETADIDSADNSNSNAVQHDSGDCPSSACKTARAHMRDHNKQSPQPSITTRISCFEPVMSVSGCQKENKRARLSSCGSAALSPAEKTTNPKSSPSIGELFAETRQNDAGDWCLGSRQRGRAKPYQRCSSAGREDLLALLNIPPTSAKHIPRVSERKRLFEVDASVHRAHDSDSASALATCQSPASDRGSPNSCAPQRLSTMNKENAVLVFEGNCQGQVNSRRSLFEGTSACQERNDSVDSDSSFEVDCRSFKYPVNRIKVKNRCLQTAVPLETSAGSFERFKLT